MQWTEKYRPQCINDMVGLQDTKKIINGLMNNGGLPNLLFHGPPGTGKTIMAIAIAQQILGDSVATNFRHINASDDRNLERLRDSVLQAVRFMPIDPSKPRLILLDEADGINKAAQRAFRAPLEQSHRTVFILTANKLDLFLDAMLSRLMVFEFKIPNVIEIIEQLQRISKHEKIQIETGTLTKIAKECKGDIRHAIIELQKEAMMR